MAGKKKKAKVVESEAAERASAPEAPAEEPETSATPQAPPEKLAWYLNRDLLLGLFAPMVLAVLEMLRVKQFTVDDSYISFRYARNFARGLGLVYNEGERVEGYTNFLWTVLLGIGIKLGMDPVVLAKVLGGACALGAMALLHRIAGRLQPYTTLPCLATWLFATSAPNTGYAMWGLETSLFVFLVLGGTFLFFREEDPEAPAPRSKLAAVPWSGVVWGLAGLTRPEAPMYMGVFMLFLGRGLFSRRNLLRGGLFVAIVGAHLLFRHSYYGSWVPNTLGAKTGNLDVQLHAGYLYVRRWMTHTGPLSVLIVCGLGFAIYRFERRLLAIGALAMCIVGYVILVGGDWMQNWRFLVPFEPFAFLLVDVALRAGWEKLRAHAQGKALTLAALLAFVGFGAWRAAELGKMQRFMLATEDHFWRMAAGGTAKILADQPRGKIVMGDIGYIGYATDFPVLDVLGLVDAKVAKMKGGYTQKVGPEWLDYIFASRARYLLLVSNNHDCKHPSTTGSIVMYRDPRFAMMYERFAATPLEHGFAWCVYELRGSRPPAATAPTPPPSTSPEPSPAPSSSALRPE